MYKYRYMTVGNYPWLDSVPQTGKVTRVSKQYGKGDARP
jgi:hypothetical protein